MTGNRVYNIAMPCNNVFFLSDIISCQEYV